MVISLRKFFRSWSPLLRAAGLVSLFLIIPLAALLLVGPHALFYDHREVLRSGLPAQPAASSATCDLPGWPDSKNYGPVPQDELPWHQQPPGKLEQLRNDLNAHRLIAAFRVTIENPLLDEALNMGRAAQFLAGSVVLPGEIFSLNSTAGPYTADRGYGSGPSYIGGQVIPTEGGGVCKVATTLYNTAILSDLPVVERHPHSMIVPYIPPGRDAAVSYGAKDLRFRNDKDHPIIVWAELVDTTLYIAMYGQYTPPAVQWYHQILDHQEPPITRQPNKDLAAGQERVVRAGYPGYTVQTWITVTGSDGHVQRRDLGVDTYHPLPRLVEYGP